MQTAQKTSRSNDGWKIKIEGFKKKEEKIFFFLSRIRAPLLSSVLSVSSMSAWRLQNEAPVRLLLKYPLRQFLLGIEEREEQQKRGNKRKTQEAARPLMDGQDFYFPQLMIGPVLTLVLPPDGNVRSHFQVNRETRGRHESIDKNSR